MIFDAHVHMGYYPRKGHRELCYYSPRRIFGVLRRCGVAEFIVSSTCAQAKTVPIADLNREAREMKRIAGDLVHVFLWVSGRVFEVDRDLRMLDEMVRVGKEGQASFARLYDGIKLHEGETAWLETRVDDLCHILRCAEGRGLPVQMHAGPDGGAQPHRLRKLAEMFPRIHFDFAHCRPMDEMAKVIAGCPNVWTDTAYLSRDDFVRLADYDWHGRLMFGTDLPVWQAHETCGLRKCYREYVAAFERTGIDGRKAFLSFIGQRGDGAGCQRPVPQFKFADSKVL